MILAPRKAPVEFLGLRFDRLDETGAVEEILRLADGPGFAYVVTPNVDHVVQLHGAGKDRALWSAYRQATLCLCDSRILQRLAHLSGVRLDLVTGSDLTLRLLRDPAVVSRRLAVIGGDAGVIVALRRELPETEIVQHVPPMGVRGNVPAQDGIACFVEESSPDLVLLAIGAPQSELVCRLIAERGKARGVALCIGASLEFMTGAKRRAPGWMQRLGLEWLFRLVSEPARLWRRYLVEGPKIFLIWWRWRRFSPPRPPAGSGSIPTDEQ